MMMLVAWTASAWGSAFAPVDLQALVDGSTAVVQVEVLDLVPDVDATSGLVMTEAIVRVEGSFAGPYAPGAEIVIREVGGTIDGRTMTAIGFPELSIGAELVLFLTEWPDGSARIAEYGAGSYAVVPGVDGPALVAGPRQGETGPPTALTPVPPGTPLRRLSDLLLLQPASR